MTRHTCTPHRCYPSRLGWGTAAFLATYLIFMHSTFFGERAEMWGKWRTTWAREWQTEREKALAEWQKARDALRAACAPAITPIPGMIVVEKIVLPRPPPIPEHTRWGARWRR